MIIGINPCKNDSGVNMRKLMVTCFALSFTLNGFSSTITRKAKDPSKDQRVIRVEKGAGDKIYFSLCANQSLVSCKQMGSNGYTQEQLNQKLKSEKFKMYAKTGGLAATVVGGTLLGIVAIVPLAGASVGYVTTVATASTGFMLTTGTATGVLMAGAVNGIQSATGRSPLEHKRAKNILEDSLADKNIQVKDMDSTIDIIEELLAEIDEKQDHSRMIANVNNSERSIIKDIKSSISKKKNVEGFSVRRQ